MPEGAGKVAAQALWTRMQNADNECIPYFLNLAGDADLDDDSFVDHCQTQYDTHVYVPPTAEEIAAAQAAVAALNLQREQAAIAGNLYKTDGVTKHRPGWNKEMDKFLQEVGMMYAPEKRKWPANNQLYTKNEFLSLTTRRELLGQDATRNMALAAWIGFKRNGDAVSPKMIKLTSVKSLEAVPMPSEQDDGVPINELLQNKLNTLGESIITETSGAEAKRMCIAKFGNFADTTSFEGIDDADQEGNYRQSVKNSWDSMCNQGFIVYPDQNE